MKMLCFFLVDIHWSLFLSFKIVLYTCVCVDHNRKENEITIIVVFFPFI
jgi:hypothetical protein